MPVVDEDVQEIEYTKPLIILKGEWRWEEW